MPGQPNVKDKIQCQLSAEIDTIELACIIMERITGMTRPKGVSAAQALADLDPHNRRGAMAAAVGAAEYFTACINAGQTPH